MDLYFERHDGEAATVENFLKVFEDVSGRDLDAIRALVPSGRYAEPDGDHLVQYGGARICRRDRAVGAADPVGKPQAADAYPARLRPGRRRTARYRLWPCRRRRGRERRHPCRKRRHVVRFSDVAERPSLSLNRGFSTPITLSIEQTQGERASWRATTAIRSRAGRRFNSLLTDALMARLRARCRGGKPPEFRTSSPILPAHRQQRDARAGLPGAGAGIAGRSRHRPRARHQHRSRCDLCGPRSARQGDRASQSRRCSRGCSARSAATTLSAPTRRAPGGGRCATSCSTTSAPVRRSGPRQRRIHCRHQHDRPLGGAADARATAPGSSRRRKHWLRSKSATAPIRWCSTNGSRSRRAFQGRNRSSASRR